MMEIILSALINDSKAPKWLRYLLVVVVRPCDLFGGHTGAEKSGARRARVRRFAGGVVCGGGGVAAPEDRQGQGARRSSGIKSFAAKETENAKRKIAHRHAHPPDSL